MAETSEQLKLKAEVRGELPLANMNYVGGAWIRNKTNGNFLDLHLVQSNNAQVGGNCKYSLSADTQALLETVRTSAWSYIYQACYSIINKQCLSTVVHQIISTSNVLDALGATLDYFPSLFLRLNLTRSYLLDSYRYLFCSRFPFTAPQPYISPLHLSAPVSSHRASI